jgi:hypothetical protein
VKVQARTVHTTTVEGEASSEELVAWLREQINIPDNADLRLWVGDEPHDVWLNLGSPLRFRFTWSGEVKTPPTTPGEPASPE